MFVSEVLDSHFNRITGKVDRYSRNGSGFVMENLTDIHLYICKYNPLRAGSWIDLPPHLKKKVERQGTLLNIKSSDNKCFLHCILASKYAFTSNRNSSDTYQHLLDEFNVRKKSLKYYNRGPRTVKGLVR